MYLMTALLFEISVLRVRVVCETWFVKYGSKHALQPLSDTKHFVHTYTRNLKSTGCIWMFYMSNDCFTIGDKWSVRAGCEIQLVSYGSKHALQSLSNKPFVCSCMHNLNGLMFSILNDCYIIRGILCVV